MLRVSFPRTIVIGVPVLMVLLFASAARAQSGQRVNFGVNPTIFRQGQPAGADSWVSSVSIAPLTLGAGNAFTFAFDSSVGTVMSFATTISVNSASLSPVDFSVRLGATPSQVVVTYNGAPKLFVTGIRHDAYANAHRIPVEQDKPSSERGSYLNPDSLQPIAYQQ